MNEFVIPSWAQVLAYAEGELKDARARLENPGQTPQDDLLQKGQIRALKKLLDLPATLAAQQFQNAPPAWAGGDDS